MLLFYFVTSDLHMKQPEDTSLTGWWIHDELNHAASLFAETFRSQTTNISNSKNYSIKR